MKNSLILTLFYALVSVLFIAALWAGGVLNLKPPQDTANLEARVTNLEKVVGLKPGGKLIMGQWEKGK